MSRPGNYLADALAGALTQAPANLVVTYHYIRPANSDGVTGITPERFAAHLRLIRSSYEIVPAEEFCLRREQETGLALITFDDAVRDQFDYAAPVLEAFNVPAVFYAPMRPYADDGSDHWCTQHLLHALAQELGWRELERRVVRLIGDPACDEAEMNRIYHYEVPMKRRLKYLLAFTLPAGVAAESLRAINTTIGLDASDWYISSDELGALQASGHALGGHGFDHVPYTTLTPSQQESDMRRAHRRMTELFGDRPRTMAYPFGRADETTRRLARQFGYIHAFTTDDRVDGMNIDIPQGVLA